jgi:hypothetical protein
VHGRNAGDGTRKVTRKTKDRAVRARDQEISGRQLTRRLAGQSVFEPQSAGRRQGHLFASHGDANAN